jgi:ankyrin repeat protein
MFDLEDGYTPLMRAVHAGGDSLAICKLLCEKVAAPELANWINLRHKDPMSKSLSQTNGFTVMHFAAFQGQLGTLKYLE